MAGAVVWNATSFPSSETPEDLAAGRLKASDNRFGRKSEFHLEDLAPAR